MPRKKKKVQLRHCSQCQTVGHNSSTCPEKIVAPAKTSTPTHSTPGMVKFFVHHVPEAPRHSEHQVNLNTNRFDLWEKVQSIAPEASRDPNFHFYHNQEPLRPTSPPSEPLETPEPKAPLFVELPHVEEVVKPISFTPPKIKKIKVKIDWVKPFRIIGGNVVNLFKSIGQGIKNIFQSIGNYFTTSFQWKRSIAAAIVLSVIIFAPGPAKSYFTNLKTTGNQVLDNSNAGFVALQSSTAALMQADLGKAEDSLVTALHKFDEALQTLDNEHKFVQSLISILPVLNDEVKNREKLLTAGHALALGNTYVLKGLSESQANKNQSLTTRVSILNSHLKAALPNYEKALADLSGVKEDVLPVEYHATFKEFKVIFATLVKDMNQLTGLGGAIEEIFGGVGHRRYLVVFQNPEELRPTGGFMGSFGVLDIKDGEVKDFKIPAGGSYYLKGQINERLEPPAPLLLANNLWQFQDSNWFPDFPASAEKMLWFYRHSRGITVDGVIAINAPVLENLLAITGPVTEDVRGLKITSDNALTAIRETINTEKDKDKTKPKQVIADLAPKFLEYFKNIEPTDLMPVLSGLQDALVGKDIQVYFTDQKTEATVKNYGWGGHILSTTNQDYVMVVNTNIRGKKSDANIKQHIIHESNLQPDGSIIDTVVITREHLGTQGEKLYGDPNVDYIRLYVPEGSELLKAGGFSWPDEKSFLPPDEWSKKDVFLTSLEKEIGFDNKTGTRVTTEFNKTVYGNWAITPPGQKNEIYLTYRLPFSNQFKGDNKTLSYQLAIQKQSGSPTSFSSQIIFPDGWQPAWKDGENLSLAQNGATIAIDRLETDTVWSLIMKK